MLFVIHALDKPESSALRAQHTEAHVAFLRSQPLRVHLAGPLLDEDGATAIGSVLIVDAPEIEQVRQFSQDDPYTKAGLFVQVQITAWRKVVGWVD